MWSLWFGGPITRRPPSQICTGSILRKLADYMTHELRALAALGLASCSSEVTLVKLKDILNQAVHAIKSFTLSSSSSSKLSDQTNSNI